MSEEVTATAAHALLSLRTRLAAGVREVEEGELRLSKLNKPLKRCGLDAALSQREQQQQLCVCLLVGDSTGACGHAAANTEPRAGDQHYQTSSKQQQQCWHRRGTLPSPCRNPPLLKESEKEREGDLVTERMMRMQREGDVAEQAAGRQKQTGGQAA
ncbi:hypothetical protein CCH79_00013267%2C partial [Scomber scombrus]|uniref:Uncharacterized protein n=1 Tax=Scomber scombrus TaxID=13677 RepID=A0AAV1Q7W0_SCOSC